LTNYRVNVLWGLIAATLTPRTAAVSAAALAPRASAAAAALAALIIPWHDALAPSPFASRADVFITQHHDQFVSWSYNSGLVIIAAVSITTLNLQNACQRLMSQSQLSLPFIFA
jgi:S-methylmethionine-dependent homocysteine/selenocysteine methylase